VGRPAHPDAPRFASQTGGRWGIHVGNQWGDEAWSHSPQFAILTTTSPVPAGIPHVVVHQEFSLTDFRYEPPIGFGPARSFVNCFPEMTSEYQGNFVPLAKAAPEEAGDIWTWVAIDAETKLVPSWRIGDRSGETATEFVCDLSRRLASRVQVTTDGKSCKEPDWMFVK
jgi:hypothetical protein